MSTAENPSASVRSASNYILDNFEKTDRIAIPVLNREFLIYGRCASPLYTHTAKDEFYVCKSRNTREARLRAVRGLTPCSNPYMLRKKLEPKIDSLLGEKLRDPEFLSQVVEEFNAGIQNAVSTAATERTALSQKLAALEARRRRILETFFDGTIDKLERDSRMNEYQQRALGIPPDPSRFHRSVEAENRDRLRGDSRTVRRMGIFGAGRQACLARGILSRDSRRTVCG
jgi:hypothetical protein